MIRNLLAVPVAIALLLAACGGGDDDGSAPGGTDGEQSSEGATGGTFRYAAEIDVTDFDPHKSTQSSDLVVLTLLYDRLFHMNDDGQPEPALAESWDLSEDGLTLTLQLREGVVFHDGEPLTAEAVVANFERQTTGEGMSWVNDLETIDSVEAVDELTVQLNLNSPGLPLLSILTERGGAVLSPATFDDAVPAGAGPFTLADHRPGDRILLERFPDYWDPDEARVDDIEITILGDPTTRLNALRTGEVDAAPITPEQLDTAESAGLVVDHATGLAVWQMLINNARPCLDNAEARRAINHAIDREAIVENLMLGLAEPASQMWPMDYEFASPNVPPDYFDYDPDLARDLLAESGFEGSCSFEIATSDQFVQVAEAMQANLADVGVDMQLRLIDPSEYNQLVNQDKSVDGQFAQSGGLPDPTQRIIAWFTSYGRVNPGGGSTPEIEQGVEAAQTTTDPDERREIVHDTIDEIADQAMHVPVLHAELLTARSEAVDGLEYTIYSQTPQVLRHVSVAE